ncbi:hypothetical protein HGQ17_11250 [Nesterenkonia sp. MY13]|uniref:Uncharacterized protein n=1 Tax=Nesterenkonia sedimenti TaxID=1463632 RepID=A0A7X8YEP2_9MICC|nr:hypothetical protein [Nesterenkonia sedimenti]NLS10556.1 hypothetical protein [Nesterenkonia sedimenti]
MRLLSLVARLPGALLPFAVALATVTSGIWPALAAASLALAGFFLSIGFTRLLTRWVRWRNLMLMSTVGYVVLVVLLIAAAEQQAVWTPALLSFLGGLIAPAERVWEPNPRLDRSALGLAFLIALTCGMLEVWQTALVASGVAAAVAVPILVMLRAGELSEPESL